MLAQERGKFAWNWDYVAGRDSGMGGNLTQPLLDGHSKPSVVPSLAGWEGAAGGGGGETWKLLSNILQLSDH